MKKTILLLFLIGLTAIGFSQQVKQDFFRPIDKNLFVQSGTKAVLPSVWLFRPVVEVTAVQLVYDKMAKEFRASSLKSMGFGVSYQHFIEVNGSPYNVVGINALLLFDATPTQTNNAALSGAITVSALKFVNLGAGYNLGIKKFFILTGLTYNFN